MFNMSSHYLLQNASQNPLALTAFKFLPSLTKTCSEPFDELLRELGDDFMLPNLRRLKPPLLWGDECCDADDESGGTNFNPTIMSPL